MTTIKRGPVPRPTIERVLEKIEYLDNGCWRWIGATNGVGYGQVWDLSHRGRVYAHIVTYTHYVGPIGEGLELDHTCRFPSCVNPAHLEPVTHAVNRARMRLPFIARELLTRRSERQRPTLMERFFAKVVKHEGGCWEWVGARSGGYGQIKVVGRGTVRAHVLSYEHHIGPVGSGLELDHTCRNRRCVNPAHLEPVTHKVNMLRSEAPAIRLHLAKVCKAGHAIVEGNLSWDGKGYRCLICHKEYIRRYRVKQKLKRDANPPESSV